MFTLVLQYSGACIDFLEMTGSALLINEVHFNSSTEGMKRGDTLSLKTNGEIIEVVIQKIVAEDHIFVGGPIYCDEKKQHLANGRSEYLTSIMEDCF